MRQKTKKLQTLKFEKPVSSHLQKNTYTHEILSVAKRGQQKVTPLILWMNFVASSFVVEWTHNNCWMAWSEYFQFFLLQLTNLWKSAPKKLLIFSASILYFFSYLYFGCFFFVCSFSFCKCLSLFLLGQNIFTLLPHSRRQRWQCLCNSIFKFKYKILLRTPKNVGNS